MVGSLTDMIVVRASRIYKPVRRQTVALNGIGNNRPSCGWAADITLTDE